MQITDKQLNFQDIGKKKQLQQITYISRPSPNLNYIDIHTGKPIGWIFDRFKNSFLLTTLEQLNGAVNKEKKLCSDRVTN